MRVNQTGAELNELGVHSIVYTSCVTLKVRTCTLEGSFLIIVIKTNIIGIILTTTTQIYAMILTNSCLKSLTEPVGIGVITEVILTIGTKAVTTRE